MFVRCWEYKVNHLSSISRSLWYNLRGSEQIIIMRYISQWNCIAPVRSQRKDVFVVVFVKVLYVKLPKNFSWMDLEDKMSFRKWRLGGKCSPEINFISFIFTALLRGVINHISQKTYKSRH